MVVKKAILAAILALALGGLAMPAAAQAPEGPFAQDFRLLTPPVPAPLEVFQDLEGATLRLADFKGKVVLLNFWATWCAPCIREMPALERLQSILKAEGLHIAAVSIDRGGKDMVTRFAKKLDLRGLPLYLDPKAALARAFGVSGLPATFLIDAQGQVVRMMLGPAEWDSHAAVGLIRYYLNSDTQRKGMGSSS